MQDERGGEPTEGSIAPVVAMGFMGLCCLGPLALPALSGLAGSAGLAAGFGSAAIVLVLGVTILGAGLMYLRARARRRHMGHIEEQGWRDAPATARLREVEGSHST